MVKISFNQHRFWRWLERELMAVLAVAIVGLGSIWASANTALVTTTIQILPAGGSITVLAPDGGETWTVDSVENITWTALGDITDVKIELQREVAGAWETIVASTVDDGSYPWTVDGPATTTATVRISKVGDASVNDVSDDVFTIAARSGGGGGSFTFAPGVDNVISNIVSNDAATVVTVFGSNFDTSIGVRLNQVTISQVNWVSTNQLNFTVPAGFPTGVYSLTVYDGQGRYSTWGSWVWVISGPIENQVPTPPIPPEPEPEQPQPVEPTPAPPINLFYSSKLINQSEVNLTLTPGQEIIVWAEFLNNGTLPWDNFGKSPTRIGTSNPRDRLSKFRATWFSGWVLKNRPANVSRTSNAGGRQTIQPNEVGRFTFKLKAPSTPGKYVESFGTVVEFRQWMQEGAVKWNITVPPRSTYRAPVATPKPAPSVLPLPSLPETPTTFYDGVELWLRSFSNFFSRLISGIGKI